MSRNTGKSVLTGCGYVQHAGYGWTGMHYLWYYTSIVLKRVQLKDAVRLTYWAN